MKNENDRKEENTMEGELFEHGVASKDTQGGGFGHSDGGGGLVFP